MIESVGSRPVASGGLSIAPDATSGTVTVNRAAVRVQPAEQVHPDAPTGPRPTFEHTYLQRVVALGIEYWIDDAEAPDSAQVGANRTADGASADDAEPAPHHLVAERPRLDRMVVEEPVRPTVDVRR